MCKVVTPHYCQWTVQNVLYQPVRLKRENQLKHKCIHKFGLIKKNIFKYILLNIENKLQELYSD